MECRQCKTDLTGIEHRMVAQWPFCVPCFEALLAPRAQEPSAPQTPAEEPADEPGPAQAGAPEGALPTETATCRLCEGTFPVPEMVHLGFWRFCQDCIRDVMENPEPPARAEAEAPEEAPEPIRPAPMAWVHCTRCGRRVPEGGAKRIDDEPYCPDCHHAVAPPPPLPDLAALATPTPGLAAARAAQATEPSDAACQACGRETPGERPLRVEGYAICRACLRADPDLAVELAGARHRRHLERMRQELG